jgi:hypothetical protein
MLQEPQAQSHLRAWRQQQRQQKLLYDCTVIDTAANTLKTPRTCRCAVQNNVNELSTKKSKI